MKKFKLLDFKELAEKQPTYAQANGLDLVIIKYGTEVSVLYGRCLHRGALMADGFIEGDNLICGVHGWDYPCSQVFDCIQNNTSFLIQHFKVFYYYFLP